MIVLLVAPLQKRLDTIFKGRFRNVSISVSLLVVMLVFGAFFAATWFSASVMVEKLPDYMDTFAKYWEYFADWAVGNNLPVPGENISIQGVSRDIFSVSAAVFGSLYSFLGMLVLIIFLVLLLLIELWQWEEKIRAAFPGEWSRKLIRTGSIIAHKVWQFFFIWTVSGLVQGGLIWLWLLLLGADFALVWGFLSFVFNYIPYIGSVIIALVATLAVFLQLGLSRAALAMAGMLVINQVVGNYLEPEFAGRTLTISPFVILASLVFWSWLWGVAGAFLAVPLTIALVVACDTIPSLRPAAILLKGEEKKKK
jgi:AI-2 transport protein TqsA